MAKERDELREFRLEELSAPHLIGADLFVPFAAKRLSLGGETEAILSVRLIDIAEPGEVQSRLRLMWSADLAGRERPAVQGRTVTGLAACAVACIVSRLYAGLQITGIAQEGDRFDYWVSDGIREFGLEVSGTMRQDVRKRHREKVAQLRKNPYETDGFVVAAGFTSRTVVFSFIASGSGEMVNQIERHGISRQGLDAAFEAEEVRKSNLMLEGRLYSEQGNEEAAADRFAEAARIEEHLARICRDKGLIEKSFVHHFSAASCWARAGNLYDAIRLCDELLARPDVPDRLRRRVHEHSESLRRNRAEWNARTLAETVTNEA